MTQMTGGEVLARSLGAHGTDVVFGIPGNHNLGIYQHLEESNIRHVLARHEQGCGYAADGYARVSGRPGVALVTAGPAVLNTLAALGQAYADSVPMLLVSPGMPLRHPYRGNGHLHETKNQHAAVDAVVSVSARVTSVAEIGDAVSHAFADMTAGRPRPVHLEVPIDVLDESADVNVGTPVAVTKLTAPPGELARAAALLAQAANPGIVVGGGARFAAPEVRRLAERLGAGVVTSTNGKGTLPEDHPLSLGAGVHLGAVAEWVRSRDVLVAVGTDLGSSDLWNGPWQLDGSLIRIDIDPRQILINAHPDVALVSDAAPALGSLLDLLGGGTAAAAEARDVAAWASRIRAEAAAEGALWHSEIQAMSAVLDHDAIVAGDSAAVCYYGLRANLPFHTPGSFLYPTGFGTLGYGLAKVAPALAAGCPVVVKPAELTPLSAFLVADAAEAIGLPSGVFNLVPGPGSEVGELLSTHPGVDVVSFTGLELGGKSASLVLPGADIAHAVSATVANVMVNSGQTCAAWTRLLVPQSELDQALAVAEVAASKHVVGDPRDGSTDLGPVISAAQRRSVLGYIAGAVATGATLVTGGIDRPHGLSVGHYVRPTVLTGVSPQSPIAQEEVFGPVLVVLPYRDVDEAVVLANGTPYGLGGSIWGAEDEEAFAIARRLRSGRVDVNGAAWNPRAPFGGYKHSGNGRELGRWGIEEFLETKAVQLPGVGSGVR